MSAVYVQSEPDLASGSPTTAKLSSKASRPSPVNTGLAVALLLGNVVSTGAPTHVEIALAPSWTAIQTRIDIGEVQQVASLAERLRRLKETTGLSWAQLGELFGVSRRSMHFWVQGGNITAEHANRFSSLQAEIAALDVGVPGATRSRLLAPDASGTSPFARMVQEAYGDRLFAGRPPLEQLETSAAMTRDSHER
jgi:transcriptional regulator with XRE-family HTH domain